MEKLPISNMSKYHKPEDTDRIGRLYRAEKKYRKGKFHCGKGKTLRSHRPPKSGGFFL